MLGHRPIRVCATSEMFDCLPLMLIAWQFVQSRHALTAVSKSAANTTSSSAPLHKRGKLNLKTAVGDEVLLTQSRREAENAEENANLKHYRSAQN